MKLGRVTKLDNKNTATSENLMMTSFQQIVTFFTFMGNLEQCHNRIPGG